MENFGHDDFVDYGRQGIHIVYRANVNVHSRVLNYSLLYQISWNCHVKRVNLVHVFAVVASVVKCTKFLKV